MPLTKSWEGAHTGSKSEDLQRIYFRRLRGKAGREQWSRRLLPFL